MVHKCCVSVCGMSVRIPGAKGLSYHTFPAKEPTREKWIQAILPHVEKPDSFRVVQGYTRVCSRHFKKKDYSMDSRKRARLSTNAVPTVFPGKNSPVNSQSKTSVTRFVEPNMRSPIIADPKEEAGGLEFSQDELGNLRIETSGNFQSCQIESVTISNDHLVLTFSEEETGSSKFSSQESLQIPSESNERDTGKMRKRRKNRSEVPRPTTGSGPKKRSSSSTSDDLSVNVVGDALAEINLSTLISVSSSADLQKELESILTQPSRDESRFRDSPGHQFCHKEIDAPRLEVVNHFDSPNSEYYHVPNNSTEIEQDLLQSIQAVSLNSGEPTSGPPPLFVTRDEAVHDSTSSGHNVRSVYSPSYMPHPESDSLLTNQIQDLYADLVDGGASLSLEDSNLATFNNQDLLEALRSATEDLELTTDIDQLARDLNVSLLDGALTTSILDINGDSIQISDLDHSSLHSSFDFGRDLMHLQEVPQPVTNTKSMEPPTITLSLESTPVLDTIQAGQTTPDVVEEPNSSSVEDIKLFVSPKVEIKSETSSPERSNGKKTTKKERSVGSFSVERFGDSDKDIEYYTGFPTFAKFEIFYRSLDSYVENLKVTDMMHGVANLSHAPSPAEAGSPKREPTEVANEDKSPAPVQEEQKRRLSQGRSMSRIDELFMTIIRLKRKIPEKVLGHMFCISQPTVSRIIRAWTMLLSRVLELLPAEKCPSSRKSGSSPSSSSTDGSAETTQLGIPRSFRQLFYSELAQSIIASGAASNSRKTSSSTSCPSVSRSKRPKKEKLVVNVNEGIGSSTQSLAVSISNEIVMPTSCLVSTGIQTISTLSDSESVAAPAMSISSKH